MDVKESTTTQKETLEQAQSFLRREIYIKYAGLLLTLSPLGNFLWSSALSGVHHWYQPHTLLLIAKTVSPTLWFLWSSALAAGLMMLKGKRSSWTFTLCILGMNIVFGIINFKSDSKVSGFQPTLSLLINLGLFSLIYVQEFHQRLEKKLRDARNRPFQIAMNSEVKVCFDEIGNWAKVTQITDAGIRLHSYNGSAPHQIEYRTIELELSRDLAVRARFSARIGDDFVFRYTNMDFPKRIRLQRWAQKMANRAA
jgi:hypothetical protein